MRNQNTNTGLKSILNQRILIGDGAMATLLYQKGVPLGVCYEELSVTAPHLIREAHGAYYEAGARVLQTHTFGANRDGLARYGLEEYVTKINRAAVKIAREACQDDAFVVGTIGSICAGRVRSVQIEGHRQQFEEQVEALLSQEVDGLLLETFVDLDELLLALEVARSYTDLPVIAQLSTVDAGRTRDGYMLTEAFRYLQQGTADVAGINCRVGPADVLRSLEKSNIPDDLLLSAYPNAGRLGISDGELAYKSTPAYFAESALRLREQGVSLIGGCCGTTPDHIRAMAEAVKGLERLPRVNHVEPDDTEVISFPTLTVQERKKPTILQKVELGYTVIVELDPPKDLNIDKFLKGTASLQEAGADAITMADNSLASTRMSNMALGAIIKQRFDIDPLVHIACRDRNLIGQQSHLMGLHALGIDQVLVITGDPSKFGDLPGASSVFDVSSFDLIRMVKQLNEGIAFSGKPLKKQAQFVVGAAFNPHVRHFDKAIQRLERKVEAGADYIMTQPVYDIDSVIRIHEATRHIPVPIFLGIMPLTGIRNAEFLHNEVPGIKISNEALERMRKQQTPEDARQEGVLMAKEWLDAAVRHFNGIYLITPFFNYEMTSTLTRYVHEITAPHANRREARF
jgi:methionine synthase I (cobalamin-dependent)/5,10-methylenetetrahydrofolate reductase